MKTASNCSHKVSAAQRGWRFAGGSLSLHVGDVRGHVSHQLALHILSTFPSVWRSNGAIKMVVRVVLFTICIVQMLWLYTEPELHSLRVDVHAEPASAIPSSGDHCNTRLKVLVYHRVIASCHNTSVGSPIATHIGFPCGEHLLDWVEIRRPWW